jgi:hypothetical protein
MEYWVLMDVMHFNFIVKAKFAVHTLFHVPWTQHSGTPSLHSSK